MAEETILVTGATGQQGGVVARYLLQQGKKIRALTRHPAKAEALKKLGAEVAVGDLTDTESLKPALRGIKKVFLVTTPFEAGMEAEDAAAAVRHRIRFVLYDGGLSERDTEPVVARAEQWVGMVYDAA